MLYAGPSVNHARVCSSSSVNQGGSANIGGGPKKVEYSNNRRIQNRIVNNGDATINDGLVIM